MIPSIRGPGRYGHRSRFRRNASIGWTWRNNTYLLVVAVVPPGRLHKFRKALRCLLMPGQRELRCRKETPGRRKAIASRLVEEKVSVRLYKRSCDEGDEQARQARLRRLVEDLLTVLRASATPSVPNRPPRQARSLDGAAW
ncbi:hypothetical protein [Lentzea sp. NPDC004782]|uniref:hypothetical protein n=1 Tax=Lentzea sp. NPDC004782 TaxID=3154458 RepID=UPI0033A7D719